MGIIHTLFNGQRNDPSIKKLLNEGAIIIDVRTPEEFRTGHVEGSLNFPLATISSELAKIEAFKAPVICCCASGMRSGKATEILQKKGLTCENGGSWRQVNKYVGD